MVASWDVTHEDHPVVATAIHNGHEIREDLLPLIALSDDERLREEDPYTGLLAEIAPSRIVLFRSRFEIDLNRDLEEAICVAPEDCWGLNVWREPPRDEILQQARALYGDFYRDFGTLLREVERSCGRFVVLDIHAYNHRRGGADASPANPRENPEVNVGTGSMDRSRWGSLVDRFVADLSRSGLDVRENVKFKGRRLARFVHETFPTTGCRLALEFKKTFMDEHRGILYPQKLQELREALRGTVPGLRESLG